MDRRSVQSSEVTTVTEPSRWVELEDDCRQQNFLHGVSRLSHVCHVLGVNLLNGLSVAPVIGPICTEVGETDSPPLLLADWTV